MMVNDRLWHGFIFNEIFLQTAKMPTNKNIIINPSPFMMTFQRPFMNYLSLFVNI